MLDNMHDLSQYAESLGLLAPVKCTSDLYDSVLSQSKLAFAENSEQGKAELYYRIFDVLHALLGKIANDGGMAFRGDFLVVLRDPEEEIIETVPIAYVLTMLDEPNTYEILLCKPEEL